MNIEALKGGLEMLKFDELKIKELEPGHLVLAMYIRGKLIAYTTLEKKTWIEMEREDGNGIC